MKEVEFQINQLMEKRNDPMDDKLTLYRQQVATSFSKFFIVHCYFYIESYCLFS